MVGKRLFRYALFFKGLIIAALANADCIGQCRCVGTVCSKKIN